MIINDVCVLGGSGFVGVHVCNQLTERGYRVTVPVRDRERAKVDLITLPTVDVVPADIHDPETLRREMRGCDAVINLVGVLHDGRGKASFREVHVELTRKVVEACRRNGIRRLVHMSALNAGLGAPSQYLKSRGEAEDIVRQSGLDFTIFRPSVIFGREDAFLNLFATLLGRLPVLPLAAPDAKFQPVYVADVARAFAHALHDDATLGQRYNLCGPKVYTLAELVRYVGAVTGRSAAIVRLGAGLSALQARALELLPGNLMSRDNLASMQVDAVCGGPFPAVFGFEPTALELVAPQWLAPEGVRSRYDPLRAQGRH